MGESNLAADSGEHRIYALFLCNQISRVSGEGRILAGRPSVLWTDKMGLATIPNFNFRHRCGQSCDFEIAPSNTR